MLSINKVMVTGRLTRDPETKYLQSGMAVTNLGLAVNRRYQDKNGEWKDDTVFLDVETWGKVAERCAESMRKGQPVFVEGRLKMDTWERDGQKQSKIKVTADFVKSFEVPKGAGGGESMGDDGEGYSEAPPARSAAPSGRGPARSGAPSDNLDFGGGSGQTKDDIPF